MSLEANRISGMAKVTVQKLLSK